MTDGVAPVAGNRAQPSVTVAVIELAGGKALDDCVDAVLAATGDTQTEILVVRRTGSSTPSGTKQNHRIKILANGGVSIPERRWTAARASANDVVAMIEDTTCLSAGWIEAMSRSFTAKNVAAVWGSIDISPDLPGRYRALGYMEYGRYDGTRPGTVALPGNCMAFDRHSLLEIAAQDDGKFFEQDIALRLHEAGKHVCFNPDMKATYVAEDIHSSRLLTRMQHGQIYGAERYNQKPTGAKIVGAIRGILGSGVLALRGFSQSVRKSPPSHWAADFFWISLMSVAVATGEIFGAVRGHGDSARSWR